MVWGAVIVGGSEGCRARVSAETRGDPGPVSGGGDRGGEPAGLLGGAVDRGGQSAGGGWELFELVEGGEELVSPGPVVLEAELGAPTRERQAGGDCPRSRFSPHF